MEVTEWMCKTDLMTRYKNQHFFEHVVKPLWQPAAQLFPKMKERLESLIANSKKYKSIAAKRAKEKEMAEKQNENNSNTKPDSNDMKDNDNDSDSKSDDKKTDDK